MGDTIGTKKCIYENEIKAIDKRIDKVELKISALLYHSKSEKGSKKYEVDITSLIAYRGEIKQLEKEKRIPRLYLKEINDHISSELDKIEAKHKLNKVYGKLGKGDK